jgi:hypothetical protein
MSQFGLWIGAYRMLIPLTLMSIVLMYEPGGIVTIIESLRAKLRAPKRYREEEPT